MPLWIVLCITLCLTALLAWGITPSVRRIAYRFGAVDKPTGGRKPHQKSTALWGGLTTGLVIIIAVALLSLVGSAEVHPLQWSGVGLGIVVLLIGGLLDDRLNLPPAAQFCFPLMAALMVVGTGTQIDQITNPVGNTPLLLGVWGGPIAILWLLIVTYAMKLLDGLDGLVAGLTVIGATLIALLASSDAFFQPLIAVFALIIAGAHLGFLPHNREGKIFLGEAGSTIAGFSLGVLAILSGAKVATAATALAIPLVDIGIVMVRRLAAGRSPFKGDTEHLHFQLLQLGFTRRTVVHAIWGVGAVGGLCALFLQTKGKLFLFAFLAVAAVVLSYVAWVKTRRSL